MFNMFIVHLSLVSIVVVLILGGGWLAGGGGGGRLRLPLGRRVLLVLLALLPH